MVCVILCVKYTEMCHGTNGCNWLIIIYVFHFVLSLLMVLERLLWRNCCPKNAIGGEWGASSEDTT
jgi:hypothetical protein